VLYPDGRFVPRWSLAVAVFGFFITLTWGLFPSLFSQLASPLGIFGAISAVCMCGSSFYAQFLRYQHYSSPLQKQQTKWFVFALAFLLVTTILSFFLPVQPSHMPPPAESVRIDLAATANTVGSVVIPLAVGIAILRYRLWDVDIIIRRTLIYSTITAILVVFYFGTVIALQQLFRSLTGAGDDLAIIISTLALYALFNPLRHRVQDTIDRRFFRRKYNAQKVIERFATTVRDEVELEKLTGELLNIVNETMQPTSVSLWLKKTERQ
jgi:uncharacterized membrane protein